MRRATIANPSLAHDDLERLAHDRVLEVSTSAVERRIALDRARRRRV